MKAWLLVKGNKFTHTYSDNVKSKLLKEKWVCVGDVNGWNMSWRYD